MTNDEKQVVALALHNLVHCVEQLQPDSEYAEMYDVPEVLDQAKKALDILTKEGD
jgi:hypothetical protein